MPKKVIIVDGQKSKTVCRLTWDGKKIEADNQEFFEHLKKRLGSPADGELFLEKVLARFKSGYMSAYQIGE